jgi:hypothetical protein
MTSKDLTALNSIVCERFGIGLTNNIMEELEVYAICTNLIINSRWAGWLPFSWMHSLAASYYARKARRIYNAKKLANEFMKLNGYQQEQ